MENNEILLTLCIPTYNRAAVLDGNLQAIYKQIKGKNLPIELIVSDNCSTDNTQAIVNNWINNGMSVNYIKNETNIGMDGNFAQCYRKAIGKYVLVLGDDDYLIDGKLEKLLGYLNKGDYGLVHLKTSSDSVLTDEVFKDTPKFLQNVSFWITYITSNVVNTKYIVKYNFEQYFGTYLTIMPLYLTAATAHHENLIIHERVFADGIVSNTNGGYNFAEVFIINYLNLWRSFVLNGKITNLLFRWIKRDILKCFIIPNYYNLLIKKEANNFRLENSWKIIIKNYGLCPYFYLYVLIFTIKLHIIKSLHKGKI